MIKDKNKKSRCTKKYQLTAAEVADMAGCSESYVKKLRADLVDTKSPLARRVLAIDTIAEDGKSLLIQEIERIVKL
jgi:predicted transcriptional regulator